MLLLIHCHPVQTKYCWPYVIESRLNDLNYIVNTPTRRKKRQICQVTTQGFSKEHRLTVDASDVGVGAVLLQEDLLKAYYTQYIYIQYDRLKYNYIEYQRFKN